MATTGRELWAGGRNWSMLEEDILLGKYCDGPGKSFSKPSLRKGCWRGKELVPSSWQNRWV